MQRSTSRSSTLRKDATLIAVLRKVHRMLSRDGGMPVVERAPASLHDRRILRLTFLTPDIQRDIVAGRQPPSLNLSLLMRIKLPLAWPEQRIALGWPARD